MLYARVFGKFVCKAQARNALVEHLESQQPTAGWAIYIAVHWPVVRIAQVRIISEQVHQRLRDLRPSHWLAHSKVAGLNTRKFEIPDADWLILNAYTAKSGFQCLPITSLENVVTGASQINDGARPPFSRRPHDFTW